MSLQAWTGNTVELPFSNVAKTMFDPVSLQIMAF